MLEIKKKSWFDKLKQWKDHPIVLRLRNWMEQYIPAGFAGMTLWQAVEFVKKELQRESINARASAIAFSLFLSLFPTIIFLFTLLPLFPIVKDYTTMLSEQLTGVIPVSAHEYIFSIIYDITAIKRDGLLSVGAALALFFSSNGMRTLMAGFDKAYQNTFKKRPWWKSRLIAIVLTIVLSLLLIISLLLMVLERYVLNYLEVEMYIDESILVFVSVLNWIITVFLVYTGISLIFTFGPSQYRRTPFINVGSISATVLSLLTSLGFSFFINNFGSYNEVYGSIGALIVIMLWIQLNCYILLICFELNASIAVHKTEKYLLEKAKDEQKME